MTNKWIFIYFYNLLSSKNWKVTEVEWKVYLYLHNCSLNRNVSINRTRGKNPWNEFFCYLFLFFHVTCHQCYHQWTSLKMSGRNSILCLFNLVLLAFSTFSSKIIKEHHGSHGLDAGLEVSKLTFEIRVLPWGRIELLSFAPAPVLNRRWKKHPTGCPPGNDDVTGKFIQPGSTLVLCSESNECPQKHYIDFERGGSYMPSSLDDTVDGVKSNFTIQGSMWIA